MRFWKNHNHTDHAGQYCNYRLLLLFVCLLLPGSSLAQGIEIKQASTELRNNHYQLNAGVNFEFNDEVLKALQHGVTLNIEFLIKVKRQRKWLWDPTIQKDILRYGIEYHALSNQYLITNLGTGVRFQDQSLEQVLISLGEIRNYSILDRTIMEPDAHYAGYLKVRLDIESLPPPLRPVAYISRKWNLKTSWYEWEIE